MTSLPNLTSPVMKDGAADVTLLTDLGRVGQPQVPLQLLRSVKLPANRAGA